MNKMSNQSYVAGADGEYRYPLLGDPLPPGGADVHLLTAGGICLRGKWPSKDPYRFYIGWAPLPKRNHERESQLSALLAHG